MPFVNHQWAAKVLGMNLNQNPGPDLIDNKKIVEIKFTLVDSKGIYPLAWTVLEYQLDYADSKTGYWGLGKYWLDRPISKVKIKNQEDLEKMVIRRELYIVVWDWINQFKPSPTSGETKISKWNNILRYPKLKDVPKTARNYEVEKGLVHLTEGVSEKNFSIITSKPLKTSLYTNFNGRK